jgi:cobalamin synthase
MNWKLIFLLSLIAIPMAFGTVYFIPNYIEPVLWIVIFFFCAFVIAKFCSRKFFLNGFMVSIFNCVWISAIHFIFFDAYYKFHPELARMNDASPETMRYMMLIFGPLVGIISGMILGLFSWIASKIFSRKPAAIPSGFSC